MTTLFPLTADSIRTGHDAMVANIDEMYRSAMEAGADSGSFYATAYHLAETLGRRTNRTTADVVGLMAVLSPQTGWTANVLSAVSLLTGGKFGNLNKAKGLKLLASPKGIDAKWKGPNGDRPLKPIVSGAKVESFTYSILAAGDPETGARWLAARGCETVCIDIHAASIAAYSAADLRIRYEASIDRLGKSTATDKDAYTLVDRAGCRKAIANAYEAVGARYGVSGWRIQEVTWCHYRDGFTSEPNWAADGPLVDVMASVGATFA